MRLIITFLMAWCLSWGAYAATAPDSKQITQELEQAKAAKPAQPEVVEALQSALNALEERKGSLERIKQYQQVIDNYPKLSATLRAQLNNMRDEPRSVSPGMSTDALNQEILQVSSQLLDKSRQAQQEQERAREIADSLNQLPQQQTDARRQLNEIERRLGTLTGNTPLNQAQNFALQSDSARLKALVDELELAQLSANNRQELARLRSELAEKESQQLDAYLQALRNQLNSQRQLEAERALESTELLAENSADLPKDIVAQFKINRELSAALNQQAQRMDLVASQQRQATSQTLQVRQALNTLREQSQWLGSSNLLGEALRAQVARLPVLWMTLGYGLREAWPYPLAVAIGDGVTATVPLLWVVMICATFARPNGLFIAHFGWPRERVSRGMRYYLMSIGLIVPLIMALMMFDNLDDREFSGSLGRLCFILICGALAVVTLSLKKAGIPLYLNKEGSGDNITNHMLWNMMIGAPLVAILASAVGYLATAQALLARLETSVAIWFLLLVVYHVIRRWMLIQRRRLAFDRAKHRRAEMLAQRARGEEEAHHHSSPEGAIEVDESEVDLDAISAQSLRLVRSILMLIALLSVIVLWSEIHSAFGFLENISLWDVTSTVQGVESLEPITLGAVLIAILVFIITTQLVRNLPALLELAILQHLDLTPGTGYAITTITKYLLMLIGGLVGFSMIGIEWSKLQWLVAALGVGLGFGLQEIFANFISGLIILFEKPIRIGDTVTIRDLTGSVTKINTRATTISDWDRKEIIVPNKAFITEQFINWSLSDSVTRVVLTIPAPADANSEEVTEILLTAARRCSLVIDNPAPEVFLVDLQQGIQIFELRIYAAEMGHRMPLRHEIHQLILAGFHAHGIDMPFPPFQMRLESLNGKQTGRTLTSAGKGRQAGSL
ncbi:miniconductance mechanosensitive channel MscM [Escherichia coli]|uniref:miniconductance mechanosensitive channel MscM n=1 Tax=Escherichia coli TaxID=562 RepID=UPI00383B14DE